MQDEKNQIININELTILKNLVVVYNWNMSKIMIVDTEVELVKKVLL